MHQLAPDNKIELNIVLKCHGYLCFLYAITLKFVIYYIIKCMYFVRTFFSKRLKIIIIMNAIILLTSATLKRRYYEYKNLYLDIIITILKYINNVNYNYKVNIIRLSSYK